jgi:hypothetical protein
MEREENAATADIEYIANRAKEAAYERGLDRVDVRVFPFGRSDRIRVELSVHVRSACPACKQPTPDFESAQPHNYSCAIVISCTAAGMIESDDDDPDELVETLADHLVGLVMRQEEELRAEATERARELHREVIEALSRGDASVIHEKAPQYGDYAILIGADLVTCAEVQANTVAPHDTENVATPLADLPPEAQATLSRNRE